MVLLLPIIPIFLRSLLPLFLAWIVFLEPVTEIPRILPASPWVDASGSPETVLSLPVIITSSIFLGVVNNAMDSNLTVLLLPTSLFLLPSKRFWLPNTPESVAAIVAPVPAGLLLLSLPTTYVLAPDTALLAPIAADALPDACACVPIARASLAKACAVSPNALALLLLLLASLPIAIALLSDTPAE